DLELVNPIFAGIQDELVGTAVGVVEILEKCIAREIADVRTVGGLLIEPVVGKSAAGRVRIGGVEHPVHNDMDVRVVAEIDELPEIAEFFRLISGVERISM